jgi:hypothetical protein
MEAMQTNRSTILKSVVAPQITSRSVHLFTQLGLACPPCDINLLEKYTRHLIDQPKDLLPFARDAARQAALMSFPQVAQL